MKYVGKNRLWQRCALFILASITHVPIAGSFPFSAYALQHCHDGGLLSQGNLILLWDRASRWHKLLQFPCWISCYLHTFSSFKKSH